jgi:hypothetical protein
MQMTLPHFWAYVIAALDAAARGWQRAQALSTTTVAINRCSRR